MADNDDDEVGYKKPPKSGQFKKGQSGCPDGGHAQRNAKKLAKKKAAETAEQKRVQALDGLVQKVMHEEQDVITPNGTRKMSNLEILIRHLVGRAIRKDAKDRDIAVALKTAQHAKLLDPAPKKGRAQVLVVYPIMEQNAWIKATEGELLPRNPLEGIPGAENLVKTGPDGRQKLISPPDDD